MKTGDRVKLTYAGRSVPATVERISASQRALFVAFDAVLGGFVGGIPLLRDDNGDYYDAIRHDEALIEDLPSTWWN